MEYRGHYELVETVVFHRAMQKLVRKKPDLIEQLDRGVRKILAEPTLGKPLQNKLRDLRRIHIAGSFVLLYDITENIVRLIDFDHHDNIYKKYEG